MTESISLDDMRIAAALGGAQSFTAVGKALAMPKQTVARRIGQLEESLGVRLVERTTRSFRLTTVGQMYAERCGELIRLAEATNQEARGEATEVSGTLRVTADPLFGELFLPELLAAFAARHPAIRVDAVLTSRLVELAEERFDVAFRIGALADSSLVATRVADARLAFCAAPSYLRRRGRPRHPEELVEHDTIALAPEGRPAEWAFAIGSAVRWVPLQPRMRVKHLGLAKRAALRGLGVANLPLFACAEDLAHGALRLVLTEYNVPFGGIYVVHLSKRLVLPRVRRFVEFAVHKLRANRELQRQAGQTAQ